MRYLFPYVYGLNTRSRTIYYKIAFFVNYLIPLFIYLFVDNHFVFSTRLIVFLLGLTATYCIYENGYVDNDYITTKREKNPSIRITSIEVKFIDKYYLLIISIHRLYAFICVVGIYILSGSLRAFMVIGFLLALDFAYAWHNTFRSYFNLITLIVITFFKYYIPVYAVAGYNKELVFNITLSFAILRGFEHLIKFEKFSECFIVRNIELFRVLYYGLVFGVSFFLFYTLRVTVIFVIIPFYMLIYRGFCLILSHTKKRIQDAENMAENMTDK